MDRTIADVVERLLRIAEATAPGDGVGVFNLVYLRTTRAVADRLGTGFFADDAFVEHFDVLFADRYFAAVDAGSAGRRVEPAWRPLFERRSDRRVHAVQFAVAGMNAHINHDLELAVVAVCEARRTRPFAGSIPADYRRITDLIAEIESEIRAALLADLERELARPFEPLLHLISSWSIGQAREAAWVRAQVLWQLRDTPLFDRLTDVSSRAVGMTGRHLLTPLLPADR